MDQKRAFVDGEADHYFQRNRASLDRLDTGQSRDPVLATLDRVALPARSILEIGCSNGWRLRALRQRYPDAACIGLDPSFEALAEKPLAGRGFSPIRATADGLPVRGRSVDLLIYGFCLYLCDRDDLFRITAEADRVLTETGHLLIFDFHVQKPRRRRYHHAPGLFSYKMDHSALFLAHPQYRLHDRHVHVEADGTELDVCVLSRVPAEQAYPEEMT